jgi:hypothetical protein
MTDLDHTLRELAAELEHPPTPDIAGAVARRLDERRPRRAPRRTRRLAIAAVIALLLPAGAIAAVPALREALGIAGVSVERTTQPPAPPPGGAPDLGRPVAVARAARLVDFDVVTPRAAGLGAPVAAYHRTSPPGGALTFAYRTGLLLTEFRGSGATRFIGKLAGPGTRIERTTIGGEPAAWLAGEPHQFAFRDSGGRDRAETLRLAGNTLLWQRGPLTLRIEGAISKATALRIARSVR